MPNLNIVCQQRRLDATERSRVDGRSLRNARESRRLLVISASGARFALRVNEDSSLRFDSFGWVTVMDFGHWYSSNGPSSNGHSSTAGQAVAEAHRPICRCLNVMESDILEAISEHEPQTVQGVSQICGAGAGCMSCHRHIRRMLNERELCQRSAQVGN